MKLNKFLIYKEQIVQFSYCEDTNTKFYQTH